MIKQQKQEKLRVHRRKGECPSFFPPLASKALLAAGRTASRGRERSPLKAQADTSASFSRMIL